MSQPVVIPESVLILKDRLKHGENVIGILESQMDTAQQNILLLQGQVRLFLLCIKLFLLGIPLPPPSKILLSDLK